MPDAIATMRFTRLQRALHWLMFLLLALVWPRLWIKLRRGSPPITPPLQRWQTQLSALTHFALYAFLLVAAALYHHFLRRDDSLGRLL